MTDTPGPMRLFDVAADPSTPFRVLDGTGALVTSGRDLAAVVIAAAGAAHRTGRAWLVAPDRWSVSLDASAPDWNPIGADGAPLDAVRRVLANVNRNELPQ